MSRFGAAAGWIGQALSWVVILGISAVLVVTVLVPRVAGATPYTILTGSMQPKYPPGTLVVIRPTPVRDIGIGQVVTYQLNSGEPTVVTHRVVGVGATTRGELRFTTQGDANNVADAALVRPVQIKGTLWYAVPLLGYVNNLLTGKERQMAVYVVASLLLGYAAFMLIGSARDARLRRREASS